jgi:hypothetical protein
LTLLYSDRTAEKFRTIKINQPTRCNNFSSLLLEAQHVSGVLKPIIRSSTTAVAASGFIIGAWW